MALTNVSTAKSTGQPSALFRVGTLTADLDASYPTGGYSLAALFPGLTVVGSLPVPHYNGATLRWLKVVDDSGTPKLRAYVNTGGAPGAQVAGATDLSAHTGCVVSFFCQ